MYAPDDLDRPLCIILQSLGATNVSEASPPESRQDNNSLKSVFQAPPKAASIYSVFQWEIIFEDVEHYGSWH